MTKKYHIDEKGFARDLILAVKANSKSGKALDPPEMIFSTYNNLARLCIPTAYCSQVETFSVEDQPESDPQRQPGRGKNYHLTCSPDGSSIRKILTTD
jgi:hypothetical protein